jgi:seryl-tRNA synthetase
MVQRGTIVLDLKLIREQPELVAERLATRHGEVNVQPVLDLDEQVRSLEKQRSRLQAESNDIGKQVGATSALRRCGKPLWQTCGNGGKN